MSTGLQQLNSDHTSNKGFTLTELMVVVSVIAILSGLIVTAVFQAREKSKEHAEYSTVEQFKLTMRLYKEATGSYPPGSPSNQYHTNNPGDNCSICLLRPGSYDLAAARTEWLAAHDAMVAAEIIPPDRYKQDVWGMPYAYDNNKGVPDEDLWSMICSLGPDSELQTFMPADVSAGDYDLTNSEPTAKGDDICSFF